jgi:hypothetical protein
MKIKTTISVLVVILFVAGLYIWGYFIRGGSADPAQDISTSNILKDSLALSEKLYDFGAIKINDGNVETKFKVTNSTEKNVNLQSITTSCMCTTAYIESANGEKGPFGMVGHGGPVSKANEIIKAGESRYIRVVYDPLAHGPAGVGQIDRFIYLTDNFGNTLQLEIKATVTP